MSLSKNSICTQAALRLGLPAFTDVETEATDEARTINESYEWCLNYLLRTHTWNFAIKRAELAQEITIPEFGYTYQYALPSDFIRDVRVKQKSSTYKIEGNKLLSNEGTIYLKYIAKDISTNIFDPMFAKCLALSIAQNTCLALTKDTALSQSIESELVRMTSYAKRINSLEGTPENITIYGLDESRYASQAGYITTLEDGEF